MPEGGKALADALRWLAKQFGGDILTWLASKLRIVWAKRFAKKNIVVLGPKQTGKSSLICFLSEGKPFKVVDGAIQTPDPTGAAVILSDDFKLPEGGPIHVPKDVGGDPHLRSQWKDLLETVRPHGIIFMLDGSKGEGVLRAGVEELGRDVLSHYAAGLNSLASLHVFLNFADRWKTTPGVEHKQVGFVQDLIKGLRSQYPDLDHIRIQVSATQLSPHLRQWPETERALIHFSADLT
jgi:hypothetical protein